MTLMLRPTADECTPREPHKRWYTSPDGKKHTSVVVDDMGIVQCSEEVVDHLMTAAGYVESEPPAWAKLMPLAVDDLIKMAANVDALREAMKALDIPLPDVEIRRHDHG